MTVEEFRQALAPLGNHRLFRRSALSIRDGAGVFERLLGGGKYKRVLEIGTYRGVTAAFIAQFCEHVTTIDLRVGQLEKQPDVPNRRAIWRALRIENIDLHLVRSQRDKAELIGSLDFDFAFVDGDHEGAGPAEDFALVKRCGAVLLHDYGGRNGVTELVRSLPAREIEIMDVFAFWRARE